MIGGELAAPPRAAPLAARPSRPFSSLPERVILFQIGCQLALLVGFLAPLRVLIRSSAYGISLGLVFMLVGRGRAHPASKPALFVLGLVGLQVLHPNTNTLLAAAGQFGMYLAILGPLFWVPGARGIDTGVVRRVLLILVVFHVLSSIFGVLQTYYPGRFMPGTSTTLRDLSPYMIELASGEQILRPMGLTDFPGGAATAGFYAVLLGAGFFATAKQSSHRFLCSAAMGIGFFCIYLSQLRSMLVLTGVCLIALVAFLARHGKLGRMAGLIVVVPILVVGSYGWATSLGGETVTGRVGSLAEGSPGEVYGRNRGAFLEATVETMIPKYPLGAGLGRWGMMNGYFGDPRMEGAEAVWVEIQWTGWLLDGGIPLILLYCFTLWIGFRVVWKLLAVGSISNELWMYAAIVLAYDVGALALTFNNPVFHSQMGLELWLLNAILFAAYSRERAEHLAAQRRLQALAHARRTQ